MEVTAEVEINRAAMTEGSDFWSIQSPTPDGLLCTRSVVPNALLAGIISHEGLPKNSQSHSGVLIKR